MQSLYRLVTGNAPGQESTTALASLGQIFFALIATFVLIALVAGAMTCWGTIFLDGGNTPSHSDVPVEMMGL